MKDMEDKEDLTSCGCLAIPKKAELVISDFNGYIDR